MKTPVLGVSKPKTVSRHLPFGHHIQKSMIIKARSTIFRAHEETAEKGAPTQITSHNTDVAFLEISHVQSLK